MKNVGLIKLENKKVFRLEGSDTADFLDRIVSNKIIDLKPGEGCHATMLTHNGFMISDLLLFRFEAHFLLVTDKVNLEKTFQTLNKYIVADDVEVFDISKEWDVMHFQGEKAPDLLKKWLGFEIEKNYDHKSFHGCHVYKVARSLYPGFDVLVSKEKTHDVFFEITREGAETIDFEAYEYLRIEAGIASYPNDITEKTIPLDVHFKDAIHYEKQCYTGQETIAKVTYRGHVNKLLARFELEDKSLKPQSEITHEGKKIGWLTSVAYSPKLQKNIALGYVKYDFRDLTHADGVLITKPSL